MISKECKINLSNTLFILGWSIYLISYVLFKQTEIMYMYNTSSVYQIINILSISIFLVKIFFIDKYSKNKLLYYGIIMLFVLVNAILVDNNTLFFSILIALSADNVDFKKFIKVDIKVRILLVLGIVGMSLLGFLPNFTKFINGSLKQAYGFTHPNILCFFVITILLELMFINKKINFKYLVINILVIYLLTIFCFSKTSVYAYILIFIINIFMKNKEKFFNKKIIKFIFILLPLLISIFSFIVIIGYDKGNEISRKMDVALTERIRAGYNFYSNYGIKLFGNKIETVVTREALSTGKTSNIFDMGYLRLIINYGSIVAFMVISLLCALQKSILKNKEYKLLLISTFFIIIGFTENNLYNIIMNFVLIYIPFIFRTKNKNNLIGVVKYE